MLVFYIPMIILGLVLLVKGADWVVDGSSSVASRFGVSPIVIGLTVVAFGTSLPELIVNIMAAIQGSSNLAIGDVLGSNIANTLLILGVAAFLLPLTLRHNTIWKEIPLGILAILLVLIMASDRFLTGRDINVIDRADGMALVSYFFIFIYYTFGIEKAEGHVQKIVKKSLPSSILFFSIGLIMLLFGGRWTVDGAVGIAHIIGLSDAFIGLTVVALGTSLPELVTSVVAARRGHGDLAIGNAIGSNIFNIFWVLGLSATIHPLTVSGENMMDMVFAAITSMLLFLALFVGRKHVIGRAEGIFFMALYIVYLGFRVFF